MLSHFCHVSIIEGLSMFLAKLKERDSISVNPFTETYFIICVALNRHISQMKVYF